MRALSTVEAKAAFAEASRSLNYRMLLFDSLIDGLYLASSAVRYVSDCHYANPVDATHLFQNCYTAENLVWIIPEMVLFMLYATISKITLQKQEEALENKTTQPDDTRSLHVLGLIAWSWPYFRDLLSGLKNGRHALVNIAILISQHSFLIFNPLGIALGVLLAINLTYYRRMNENREKLYQHNNNLRKKLKANGTTPEKTDKIERHSQIQCLFNYFSAGFDGLTDGGYLYGCFITALIVCGLSGATAGIPVIASALIIGVLMTVSFITKIHDEYLTQRKFKISQLLLEKQIITNDTALSSEVKQAELTRLDLELYSVREERAAAAGDDSPISNVIFIAYYLLRALISGAKNSDAAFKSLEALFVKTVLFIVLSIAQPVCTAIYALYLLIRETYRGVKKHDSAYSFSRHRPLEDTASTQNVLQDVPEPAPENDHPSSPLLRRLSA